MSPTSSQSLLSSQSSGLSSSPKHPNTIGKVIKRHHWRLDKVAEQTGIPRRTLIDYCAGRTAVPPDRLEALSRCLSYPTSYLVPRFREAYLLISRDEQAKDEQALLQLRTHCEKHPTDENALRELIVMLATRGQTAEIERVYVTLLKELNTFTSRGPEPSTSALVEECCAHLAQDLDQVRQAPPTEEKVVPERSTQALGASALQECDGPLPPLPSTLDTTAQSRSNQNARGIGSPAEPSPRSDKGTPPPPPNPHPLTAGNHSDSIVIQTSQVQIVVQSIPDETPSGRTVPSVLVTPPLAFDPTTNNDEPPSPSSGHLVFSSSQSANPQGIIRSGEANAYALNARNFRDSYLPSSTDIVPSLKAYSTFCQGELTTCRQQIDIYETIERRSTMSDEQSQLIDPSQITRRDLIALASVSFPLITSIRQGRLTAGVIEEFLSEVTASVTTCWYLLQGDGLTTVEVTLPLYLPELVQVVKSSSLYRKRAAYLAAQGFLLLGLLAHHRVRYAERVAHCQKAVSYASASGDLTLLVACLVHLSDAFLISGQREDSLSTCVQAEGYSKELSGFLRSKLLAKSAHADAQQGNSQKVTRFLGEAYATFTDADDETPVFLLACCGLFEIILDEGLSTFDLGNHAKDQGKLGCARKYWKDAAEKFSKMEKLPSGIAVPVRIGAEVLIAQALAYAKARNMEGFLTAFEKGVQLAKELGSEKRKQEAKEALEAALEQWPNDQRITGLWELLV